MVKSTRSSLEEEVYDDKELHATIYAPSHNNDAKGTERQLSTRPRSKHSATEQRRRSKINERFQILRDLIPQNDQKRDKASFLLEVIEYIHFLQEKLQIYEGPIQAWGQETTKLMPHRNNHEPLETYPDPFQVIANGSAQEKNVSTPSIANAQNLVQSDFGVDAAYRVMDHPHWSDTQTAVHVPLQPNMFSARSGIPLYPLQGTVTDADRMVAQDHCHLDQLTGGSMECSVPSNTLQGQECRTENRLDSISSACSDGHCSLQELICRKPTSQCKLMLGNKPMVVKVLQRLDRRMITISVRTIKHWHIPWLRATMTATKLLKGSEENIDRTAVLLWLCSTAWFLNQLYMLTISGFIGDDEVIAMYFFNIVTKRVLFFFICREVIFPSQKNVIVRREPSV